MRNLALIALTSIAFSCSAGNVKKRTKPHHDNASNLETNSEEQDASDPFKLVATKVKNCDRFLSTLSKLTGVKLSQAKHMDLRNKINSIKSGCPSSMQVAKLSSNNILFFQKTSLEFCAAYVDRILEEKIIVEGFDYTKKFSQAFSDDASKAIITYYYNELWYGDVRTDIPSLESIEPQIHELITDVKEVEEIPDTVVTTKSVMIGMCVPFLSSSPVTAN